MPPAGSVAVGHEMTAAGHGAGKLHRVLNQSVMRTPLSEPEYGTDSFSTRAGRLARP